MGWFEFSRSQNYPTHYADQHSPAHVDVLTAGLVLAFLILGISLLSLIPSYTGSRRWVFLVQVLLNLFIGGVILVGNFGQSWEVGKVSITSPYKAVSPGEIQGQLGLHIGLRGINITLKGSPRDEHSEKYFEDEEIDYNEHFSWEWAQGRFGFGYYAGRIARDFRAAVYRGIPLPILQLAEYFTFDGEGIRFGRHYRLAGWYAHIMMWTAFPCWLISNILFCVVVRYGALFLIGTGIFQVIAVGLWFSIRNFVELQVPYEYKAIEVLLKTHFGSDFYFVLFNGILCIGLGAGIFMANAVFPDQLCQIFGIDPLTLYDEYHLTTEEIEKEKIRTKTRRPVPATMEDTMERGDVNQDPGGEVVRRSDESHLVLRRRTDAASRLFKKSFKLSKRRPTPPPPPARNKPGRIDEESEMSARTPLLSQGRESELSLANYPPPSPVRSYN